MNAATLIDENTKRIMNEINAFARRCRIGKVTWKHFIPAFMPPRYPGPLPTMPVLVDAGKYMPKCGCKIGSACNNAACPHAAYVTC